MIKTAIALTLAAALAAAPCHADSLFNRAAEARGSLITNETHRHNVGDIVTVLVRETIDASTQANTQTQKDSEIRARANPSDNPFLVSDEPGGLTVFKPNDLPNWRIEADNEHRGSGSTRKNNLVTTIACQVTHVYPNGNLRIEGQKKLTVNREDSELYIAGIIRGRDVSPANTISSNQVANATVELKGRGPIWNTQRRGILSRITDWFSPF